jgi:hypothetical protein
VDLTWALDQIGQGHGDGRRVVGRGEAAGAIRADVALGDVLKMAKAFAIAGETSPEGPALAERLLVLAMVGLRPRTARR